MQTQRRLNVLAHAEGLSADETINLLIDFWEMRRLDRLIAQVKLAYEAGMTALQLGQLQVLYSLVELICLRVR